MGRLANSGMDICSPPLEIDVTPRVFFRQSDGDFEEIPGVTSFERTVGEGGSSTLISIGFAPSGSVAMQSLLDHDADSEIDVKMEFMFGMLMVMSFSGFVEQVSADQVVISVSTPIATDMQDIAQ